MLAEFGASHTIDVTNLALLALRCAIGSMILAHGLRKFFGGGKIPGDSIVMFARIWHYVSSVLQKTWEGWQEDDGFLLSAAMAYYAAFSLFPLCRC